MGRYLVEVVSVATDTNPYFAGNKIFNLYAKGACSVKYWGDSPASQYDYTTQMNTQNYFKTKAAATRALHAWEKDWLEYSYSSGYWIKTARVVDFDNYQASEADIIAEKLQDDYYATDIAEVY